MSNAVYEIVTNKILDALNSGNIPWKKPWAEGNPPANFFSKRPYHGINSILLSLSPYDCPYWGTMKQISEKGGKVKKGEKASIVVFWNFGKKEESDGKIKKYAFLRYYNIFNMLQTEGIELPKMQTFSNNPIEQAENIVKNMPNKPEIKQESQRAFYSPLDDVVNIPKFETFVNSESYYSTLFHELSHSTGHSKRLDRHIKNYFGSMEYASEELVAEISSAFLCNGCGISNTIENSAAYIDSWRKKISEDKQLIVKAASAAQKASDYILGKKQESNVDGEAQTAA